MIFVAVVIFIGVFAVALPFVLSSNAKGTVAVPVSASTARFGNKEAPDPTLGIRKSTLLSAIPWVHRLLMRFELAPQIRMLLYQSNLKWTVGGLLLTSGALFVVSAYLVWLRVHMFLVAVILGLAVAAAPFIFVVMKRNRRFGKFEEGLPDALDLMVSALRVGQSLNAAMSLVGRECPEPIGNEFRICFDEQNFGLDLRMAAANLITRMPVQDLRLVTTAILIQKESGGNLAEVLENAAHVT